MAEFLEHVQKPAGCGLPFQHTRICTAFIDALWHQVLQKLNSDGNDENVLVHLVTVTDQYSNKDIVTTPKFRRFVKKVAQEFKEKKRKVTALFLQKRTLIGSYLTVR